MVSAIGLYRPNACVFFTYSFNFLSVSGYTGDTDGVPHLERLESSPTYGARRRSIQQKPRNLEMVVTSNNTFDVRDLDDSNDSCDSIPPPPLPQLPSAFNSSDNKKR